ncbi:MAG: hypothetical protein FWC01_02760 [Treponema sp.]|nr:hypothetical protein [Treponema sp.]
MKNFATKNKKRIINYVDKAIGLYLALFLVFFLYLLDGKELFNTLNITNILFYVIFIILSFYFLFSYFYYNDTSIVCGFLFFKKVIEIKTITSITFYIFSLIIITYNEKKISISLPHKSKSMNEFLEFIKTNHSHVIINY